jgi:bifunctional UDP-N-acetylglucosamine pyrophosphorylase/glucosamine-1-phosphate N-acetyltransferase
MPEKTTSPKPLNVLVMAAGLGTRMKSNRAKVLHELGGSPLIAHVTRTAQALKPQRIVVVIGHQAEEVERVVLDTVGELASFVVQAKQRGTGDAVESARNVLESSDSLVLVLSGDVPMIKHHNNAGADCTVLSVRLENPTGYGRVIRDESGAFQKIVEQRDATEDERQVKEINAGIYCFDASELFKALRKVEPANDQGEYYLTDVPAIIRGDGGNVSVFLHDEAREVYGINSRAELAEFENLVRRAAIRKLMIVFPSIVTFGWMMVSRFGS